MGSFLLSGFLSGLWLRRSGFVDLALSSMDLEASQKDVVLLLGIFGLILLRRTVPRATGMFLLGACWALTKRAPLPPQSLDDVLVVHSTFAGEGRQSLIVCEIPHTLTEATVDGCRPKTRLWEVVGQGAVGQTGSVRVQRREDILAGWKAQFRVHDATPLPPPTVMGRLAINLKKSMKTNAAKHDALIEAWLRGVIIGEQSELPGYVARAFKRTGLYHLIVVSGSHVSFAAFCASMIILLPWQIAYAVRWLSPEKWIQVRAVMVTLAMIAAWVYAVLVGLPQSAQRALLGFLVFQSCPIFFGTPHAHVRLLITALAQALFYPVGFASTSTLLSWGACLIVVSAAVNFRGSFYRRLGTLFFMQLRLTILLAAVTGQFCVGGILINLIVLPVFPLVFLSSALLVTPFAKFLFLENLAVVIVESFIRFVIEVDKFGSRWDWFVVDLATLDVQWRWLFLGASGVIVLNALANLSIAHREGPGPTNAPIWESL